MQPTETNHTFEVFGQPKKLGWYGSHAARPVFGPTEAPADEAAEWRSTPYGWDPNAVRVGVAALVRAAAVRLIIGGKTYTNPNDRELVDCIRVSRQFDRAELVLEDEDIDQETLTAVREFLIRLTKSRKIDETPAALERSGRESWQQPSSRRPMMSTSGPMVRECPCRRPSPTARMPGGKCWS